MLVSLSFWQIYFSNCHSLKDRRRLVNSLTDRLRKKFSVSCRVETGSGERKKGVLGVSSIVLSESEAEKLIQQIEKEILMTPEVVLIGVKKCLLGSEVIEDELEDRAFESYDKGRDWEDDGDRTG